MNLRLVSKMLGVVAVLIGVTMIFSLPWAHPGLGVRAQLATHPSAEFEKVGFLSLLGSVAVCFAVGALFYGYGRKGSGRLYRKEAMAVVGMSWVLATILGALPFWFSDTLSVVDSLFESQSGFSTTGATVITDLENPSLVPHCILFWRSSTHFLGGLGIIVLFVVLLGQGSAGKALMRAEMPGPTKEGSTSRMQHTAWLFAAIYCALNVLLTIILKLFGLSLFDAFCHAFGTLATGGFSTYNASLGHFNSPLIDSTIIVFMVLAGTNFTLLYLLLMRQPMKLLVDVEWRTYMSVIVGVTILVVCIGLYREDFGGFSEALLDGLFQVVSIVTTTGYGTADFDSWNSFGRGVLLLLMFVGGCAGSTGGGMKVIRHVLFQKIIWLEIEQAYRPTVVRPLRLGGKLVEDQDLRKNILVYFGLVLVIFVFSWMFLVATEPESTWGEVASTESSDPPDPQAKAAATRAEPNGLASGDTALPPTDPEAGQTGEIRHKLIDSASAIAATLNNIGPGLGTVGPKENYAHFSWHSKLLFIWLMMLGRLELFSILVLVIPGFWRSR